jgi:hypothetical protein
MGVSIDEAVLLIGRDKKPTHQALEPSYILIKRIITVENDLEGGPIRCGVIEPVNAKKIDIRMPRRRTASQLWPTWS